MLDSAGVDARERSGVLLARPAFEPARPAILSVATEVPQGRLTSAELAQQLGITGIASRITRRE
jgi:hypothetical protein